MTTNDELDQRLTAIEHRLGMEHEPPLDRLSGIGFKIDTVRDMVQQLGLSLSEQQRLLVVLEARQLEHDRRFDRVDTDLAITKAGVQAILDILNRDQP